MLNARTYVHGAALNKSKVYWIAYQTMLRKEFYRILRIWIQTLLAPGVTTFLYFTIFGRIVGNQIGDMSGFSYVQFIAPGLIVLAVVTNAFGNVSATVFGARFQRNIEELLVSPMPNWLIMAGFISGGMIRGLLCALMVTIIALCFTTLPLYSLAITLLVLFLSTLIFSLLGFMSGLYARNFDEISFFPTFIIAPMTYLGGVFYSIHMLSPFWQFVSKLNPIFYIVNGYRDGLLGISDIQVLPALTGLIIFVIILTLLSYRLIDSGRGIRS